MSDPGARAMAGSESLGNRATAVPAVAVVRLTGVMASPSGPWVGEVTAVVT